MTGGWESNLNGHELSSTELLVQGAAEWTSTGSLPSPRYLARGVTINNQVIVTGMLTPRCAVADFHTFLKGGAGCYIFAYPNNCVLDEILQFEAETGEWQLIGHMRMARGQHATSVINFNEIKDYCN